LFDILLDLLELLGLISLRKKKKGEKEFTSLEINDSTHKQDSSGLVSQQGVSICAGCHRTLEKGAIYESGETWCTECYKTHVLKIKS
jgi:protein-arginine kinase activator protein McsA